MSSVSFLSLLQKVTLGVHFGNHKPLWRTYPMGVLLDHCTFRHDFPELRLFFSPFLHMLGNFFRELPRIGPWSSHHYKGCSSCATTHWQRGMYLLTGYQGQRRTHTIEEGRGQALLPRHPLKLVVSSLLKLRYERCFRLSSRSTTLRRRTRPGLVKSTRRSRTLGRGCCYFCLLMAEAEVGLTRQVTSQGSCILAGASKSLFEASSSALKRRARSSTTRTWVLFTTTEGCFCCQTT